MTPERPSFAGEVIVTRRAAGAFGIVLAGRDAQGGALGMALSGVAAPALAERLHDVSIEGPLAHDPTLRIVCREGVFAVPGARLHVHRDLSGRMRAVIPPRPVPLRKRAFWRIVLALAGSATGRAVLLRLRQR